LRELYKLIDEGGGAFIIGLQLGDAMPHLRAKAQPPPGFFAAKHDFTEAPGCQNSNTLHPTNHHLIAVAWRCSVH